MSENFLISLSLAVFLFIVPLYYCLFLSTRVIM
jgi:hypothetical protein